MLIPRLGVIAELPYDNRPPPVQIAPGGQRFAVDVENQYATWMDFSFFYSFRRDSGLRLWDIKYKNETVMYELGLNEALAHCELDAVPLGAGSSLNRISLCRRRQRSHSERHGVPRHVLWLRSLRFRAHSGL